MRRAITPGFVAAVLMTACVATANDAPLLGRVEMGDDLLAYYGSERTTGYLFAAVGVASAVAGTVLVTRSEDFSRGLGWSVLSLGALELLGGAFYVLQVGGEIDHYTKLLGSDPPAFKTEEALHIHGTTSRFVFYRVAELVVAAAGVGVAAYGFAANRDPWKGAGIGIAGEALTLFALDAYGQTRATRYEDQLHRFEPTLALSLGTPGAPWGLGLRGAF
jgi:hypothetical protein